MDDITFDDIRNMSDEEVAELNKKLGKKVLAKFVGFHISKWVLIVGVSYAFQKYLESSMDKKSHR